MLFICLEKREQCCQSVLQDFALDVTWQNLMSINSLHSLFCNCVNTVTQAFNAQDIHRWPTTVFHIVGVYSRP